MGRVEHDDGSVRAERRTKWAKSGRLGPRARPDIPLSWPRPGVDEAKKVLINQLTLELGSAQAALLANKDSVEVKEAFEKVLEEKEIELEQMRNELKKKLK